MEFKKIITLDIGAIHQTMLIHDSLLFYEYSGYDFDNKFITCFSLESKRRIWKSPISNMGIHSGAVLAENKYIYPTLSNNVYIFDSLGDFYILKLDYRCKISPLVYENTFILQDRGVGLKCFDSRTLENLWLIKQNKISTMSQPIIQDGNLLYILDDKKFESFNLTRKNQNWSRDLPEHTLSFLFAAYDSIVLNMIDDLNNQTWLEAININTGKKLWKSTTVNTIDKFERSVVKIGNILYCKGYKSLIKINFETGDFVGEIEFNNSITTNLIKDESDNLYFGLNNRKVVKFSKNEEIHYSNSFKEELDYFFQVGNKKYLYCGRNLFLF